MLYTISSPITSPVHYLKQFGSIAQGSGKKEDEDKDMDGIEVRDWSRM